MRVLTVGSLPPEWGGPVRGGVATFHASLLTGLLERSDEVEVLGVLPPGPLKRATPVPAFVRSDDIDRAEFYERLLDRLEPDVVVMNHIAHTVGVTHARLRTPIPAVGVVHSWHNVTFAADEEERARAIRITQEAMDGLSAMIVPSRHGLAEGLDLGFRYPSMAKAIHNPLPPTYGNEAIDVSAHRRSGTLYLGSLVPRKAPAALVEAAALLGGANVHLVGDGALESELRLLIERRRLDDRVRIVGALPEQDHLLRVRDCLLRAETMCLPSRSESFGLVFIEALACGTPIVGFGPTVREIGRAMGTEVGESLERGTPEEIAAAIERVIEASWDRELLRRATLAAFGLPRVTERYIELFHELTVAGGIR